MGLPAWESAQKMEQATGKHFMLLLPMTAETSGDSSSFLATLVALHFTPVSN